MPSSAYAAFSTVSLLPVPMAIRGGLAVSVRGRVSSSTPWSQLAATFLGVDAGVDILQLKTRVGLRKFPVAGFSLPLRFCIGIWRAGARRFPFSRATYQTRPSSSRWKGTGRGGCCSREPRRPAGGGLGTDSASPARRGSVPAGTADRGDVLGGVSAGTVPTAGAVRESAPGRAVAARRFRRRAGAGARRGRRVEIPWPPS